MNIKYY